MNVFLSGLRADCKIKTVNPPTNSGTPHGILGTLLTKVVEPTNNDAKRQLRELVIYRKISLFIQSETGRRFIETIFSVIATKSIMV
ncbi:MAG: transposase [Planctomycetota bacterium]|nr:transposase [Planctomycetota bacterium]